MMISRPTPVALILLAAATLPAPVLAQSLELRPGAWETRLERTVEGQAVPPLQDEECLTLEDLKAFGGLRQFATSLALPLGEEHCTISNYKVAGGRVTFTADCVDEGERTRVEADVTVASDAYTVATRVGSGGKGSATMKMTGTRKGECRW